jgi:hypothetical protein
MLKIINFDGTVVAPGGDYPWGNIKNKPDGTKINVKSNADMHQLHQKMMADAGMTPNGLPDNVSNGFQLSDALQILCARPDITATSRVNMDGDTITFEKTRTIIYSATTGSGPGVTLTFDMTGAIIGSEVIIQTGLPGTGVFLTPSASTINFILFSPLIIGASANGSFRFKFVGYLAGTYYITAQFFGY